MQWRGKHVSAAMNDHETIKGLWRMPSSGMWCHVDLV
jgi:hypothetical protein